MDVHLPAHMLRSPPQLTFGRKFGPHIARLGAVALEAGVERSPARRAVSLAGPEMRPQVGALSWIFCDATT